MKTMGRLLFFAVCGGAVSCGAPSPSAHGPASRTGETAARPESTSVPVAAADSASALPVSASGVAPVAPGPPPLPSPFVVVSAINASGVFALKNTIVLTSEIASDKGSAAPSAVGFTAIADDKITSSRDLALPFRPGEAGGLVMASVEDLAGDWPSHVYAFGGGSDGRVSLGLSWELSGGRWRETSRSLDFVTGVARAGGSIFALVQTLDRTAPAHIDNIDGSAPSRALTPGDAGDRAACGSNDTPPTKIDPDGIGGTARGTLFVAGSMCGGALGVETWPKGASNATVEVLSKAAPSGHFDFASGPNDEGWIYGPKVYHYDGKSWSEVASTPSFEHASVAPDGVLWGFTSDGKLYRGGVSGFVRVSTPKDTPARALAITDDGTVWVSTGSMLYRTARAGEQPSTPDVAVKDAAPAAPHVHFEPGGPACKSNVVVLLKVTKETPDDFTFPATRAALKGHTELEGIRFAVTSQNGRRFFTALPKTYDDAKKVADVVSKGVRGTTPKVVCAVPEIVREVHIDLKSGDIVK